MRASDVVFIVVAVGLLVYLGWALLWPEDLQ